MAKKPTIQIKVNATEVKKWIEASGEIGFHAGYWTCVEELKKGLSEVSEWLNRQRGHGRLPMIVETEEKLKELFKTFLLEDADMWIKLKKKHGDLVGTKADGTPYMKKEE